MSNIVALPSLPRRSLTRPNTAKAPIRSAFESRVSILHRSDVPVLVHFSVAKVSKFSRFLEPGRAAEIKTLDMIERLMKVHENEETDNRAGINVPKPGMTFRMNKLAHTNPSARRKPRPHLKVSQSFLRYLKGVFRELVGRALPCRRLPRREATLSRVWSEDKNSPCTCKPGRRVRPPFRH